MRASIEMTAPTLHDKLIISYCHTDGDTVLREPPNAHPVSPRDTEKAHFISSVKYNTSSSSAGDIVREALLGASADVQSVIPTMENLKQLKRRQNIRSQGYNVPTPRSAASIVIPFEYQNDGHLLNPQQFLYRDCYTPNGKRVIAFISVACLESLNNPEIYCAFLDGTFKIMPKYMNQVWILRAFIGDSTIALTYAYFLLESKLAESYTLALSIIKTAAPLFNPPNFMVDFEATDAVLSSDFCAVFGLAFVPIADIGHCWTLSLLKNLLTAFYPSAPTITLINYLESTWLYSTQ